MSSAALRGAFFAYLVWVPIPLGSNRPVFWVINAVVSVAILALLLGRGHRALKPAARRMLAFLIVPALILVCWMLVQAVPWTPDALHHPLWRQVGLEGAGAISLNPSATLTTALQFLTVALAAIIAARIAMSGRRALGVLYAVVVSALIVAVWGLVALALDVSPTLFGEPGGSAFLTSFFVNRNTTATFLGLGLVGSLAIAIARLAEAGGRSGIGGALLDLPRRAGPSLVACLILGAALIATGSRAGLLAAVIATVVTIAFAWRQRSWVAPLVLGAILISLGGAVLLFGTSSGPLFDRLAGFEIGEEARWDVYRDTAAAIADRPLVGHGAGTFPDFYPLYHGPDVPSTGIWLKAHNTYLQAAAELGLPAFIAGALTLLLYIVLCARGARRRSHPAPLAAIGGAALVGVHSLFDFSVQIEAVGIVFAAMIGAGLAVALARPAHTAPRKMEPSAHRYETYDVVPESVSHPAAR